MVAYEVIIVTIIYTPRSSYYTVKVNDNGVCHGCLLAKRYGMLALAYQALWFNSQCKQAVQQPMCAE